MYANRKPFASVFMVLLLCAAIAGATSAFAQKLDVTAINENGQKTKIRMAEIDIESHKGYEIGSSFQALGGVSVTEPVTPPSGVELKKKFVPWTKIQKIEWLEINRETGNTKAKVTYADGKEKECFLFREEGKGRYSPLWPINVLISGKTNVAGKEHDVTLNTPVLRKLIFNPPK